MAQCHCVLVKITFDGLLGEHAGRGSVEARASSCKCEESGSFVAFESMVKIFKSME